MTRKGPTRAKVPRTIPTRAQLLAALIVATAVPSAHAEDGTPKDAHKKGPGKTTRKKSPSPPPPPIAPSPQVEIGGVPPHPDLERDPPSPQACDAGTSYEIPNEEDAGTRGVAFLKVLASTRAPPTSTDAGEPPFLVDGTPHAFNEPIELRPGVHHITILLSTGTRRKHGIILAAGESFDISFDDIVAECTFPQVLGGVPPYTAPSGCCGTSHSAYNAPLDLRALAGTACALALATGRRRKRPR